MLSKKLQAYLDSPYGASLVGLANFAGIEKIKVDGEEYDVSYLVDLLKTPHHACNAIDKPTHPHQ
jgi:hypothetical protein